MADQDATAGTPLWLATSARASYPALRGAQRYDVVVVGAGITGTTTALLLKRAGARVALLEMGTVCQGVTGHTTAKVTALHRLTYADLSDRFGLDTAQTYARANQAGLATIRDLVDELAIDCALEQQPAYTYAGSPEQVAAVEAEAEAAARAGLPARLVDRTDLPFPVAAAVRVDDQAQLHPGDYVRALAAHVDGDGSAVHEHSRVVDVRDGQPCRVATPDATIEADHVVVATHLPLLDRGLFFALAHPQRSYALAARVRGPLPEGMYINVEEPTRSVRPYRRDGAELLIVSGEGHKPGADDEAGRSRALEAWTRATFDVHAVDYRWSAQDYEPVDKLPLIGPAWPATERLWVATGFRKWGLALGTAAAMLLTDLVGGRTHPWADTFAPHRLTPKASAASFVRENLEVARHFVGDRVALPGREAVERLEPGQGCVARIGGRAYAVARADDGALTSVSPLCTHMGCHVRWNTAERSWDCPCHGSRFAVDGTVVQGPAVRDLDPKPLPRE